MLSDRDWYFGWFVFGVLMVLGFIAGGECMSRFTKGPWVADKTSRAVGPVSKEDDQSYGMVLPVAWVEFEPEVEIQAANQQLIAAAPELLEALRQLRDYVEDVLAVSTEDCEPEHPLIRATSVISKALGQ